MNSCRYVPIGFAIGLSLLVPTGPVCAQPPSQPTTQNNPPRKQDDLTNLSIDDLMKVTVTTASKSAEQLGDLAAAVFVISQDDIRRSGVTSIPDALRLAPGVQVAQITANSWAVSIRGFNSRYTDKLLVLVDGRSVYTPLFGGVYWEDLDLPLEDIERIEVVRGPGGALWGANAVNGVINIITKSAKDTQGTLLSTGAGNLERGFGLLRHGGMLDGGGSYRVYGKAVRRESLLDITGARNHDAWEAFRTGARLDWGNAAKGATTVDVSAYRNLIGERSMLPTYAAPFAQQADMSVPVSGLHFLTRWEKNNERGRTMWQGYYWRTDRYSQSLVERRDLLDLQFERKQVLRKSDSIAWGFQYQRTWDQFTNTPNIIFTPASRTDDLYGAFVHGETMFGDWGHFSIGTKLQHNSYSGLEVQPSARLAAHPSKESTVWASISRAVRTPTRATEDALVLYNIMQPPGQPIVATTVFNNKELRSENVLAYELGYRRQMSRKLYVDVASFYNVYGSLRTVNQGTPQLDMNPVPHVVQPLVYSNGMSARTYGLEMAANYTPSSRLRLTGSYSLMESRFQFGPNDTPGGLGLHPRHQVHLGASVDIPGKLSLDAHLFGSSRLTNSNVGSYWRFDTRLGWRPSKSFELSLVGQNLIGPRHQEFGASLYDVPSLIERSVYGKATWSF